MKRIIIVHGYKGSPSADWIPWFGKALEAKGFEVCIPAMPDPESPVREKWVEEIQKQIGEPAENIFLVGFSLGSTSILRYLETLSASQKIGGAVLVSGFVTLLPMEKYRLLDPFVEQPFAFEKIKIVAGSVVVIQAENDSIVPFENAEKISQGLDGELIAIPKGGHLSQEDGFLELPQALEAIVSLLPKA